MDLGSLWREVVDQGLLWLLVPFALVVWWGFRPYRRQRRDDNNRPPESGPFQ